MARTKLALIACSLLATSQPVLAGDHPSARSNGKRILAHDIADTVNTAANWDRLHSVLISQGGDIVYESYFNGHGPDELENVKSVSKSVLSALVGIAIDRGEISSVDATLDDYFHDELARSADSTVSQITVENLLTMQAGLKPTSSSNYGAWVASNNWITAVLDAPLEATPGREMLYSTGNTHLLSAILTRATGKTTLQFARDTLSEPLGFELASWPRDPQGVYFGGNDMEFTPRQLLALGELYLNEGRADGVQVIPERWIKASLAPHARSPQGDARYYGYGWWVCELAGYTVPHAWGHGGQFIMLVPELDLVIVSTSSPHPGPDAQVHANKVYGLLQQIIHVAGNHAQPQLYYAANQSETNAVEQRQSSLY